MNRKVVKITILVVVLVALVGGAIGLYLHFHKGPIVGRIQFGAKYNLVEINPTELFAGAEMSSESYFEINANKQTGRLYLKGLTATNSAPLSFIVTKYKEGIKETVIEFEFIIDNGEKTKIQRLKAISTNKEIRIKDNIDHAVSIIEQNPNDITSLKYTSTLLVFQRQEVA